MTQLILLLALGSGMVAAIVWERRRRQHLTGLWAQAAERVGGTLRPASGPWYGRTPMSIHAVLDQVPVTVDSYVVSNGKNSITYTRVGAPAPSALDFELDLFEEGFLSSLGKALGTQDVEVGDPVFDRSFIVKASDETQARAWLGPRVRQTLLECLPYSFRLKKQAIVATRVGLENEPARLAMVMQGVAALAASGRTLLEHWQHAAEDLGGKASHVERVLPREMRITWMEQGIEVTADLVEEDAGGWLRRRIQLGTRVWAPRMARDARFVLERGGGPESSYEGLRTLSLPEDLFGGRYRLFAEGTECRLMSPEPELASRLDRLAPELVWSDAHKVGLVFEGLVSDAEVLRMAGEVVATLAMERVNNPYR